MTLGPDWLDLVAVAVQLDDARTSATPIDFVTATFPDLSWAEARAIARFSDRLRVDSGDRQIGWKLGWTSAAMRTALGIDRPNWGTLWQSQVAGRDLNRGAFIHPKVEPELVWRCPVDLAGDATVDDIVHTAGEWALGIEVVDPRFPSFDFDALDNTADNSSSAAIRLGEFVAPTVDVAQLEVTFSDGNEQRSGLGSQAMGSPWEAIAWLVRSLAEEDLHLHRGDLVFTGGLTAPFDVVPDVDYRLECRALESVALRFT